MSDAQKTTPPPRSGLQAGIDWVGKHWPRVRLGHEGVMLDKITRQNRCVETLARNAMTGKLDDTEGWPGSGEPDAEGGDGMGVKIGDEIHHHNYPLPPTSEPLPQSSTSPAAEESTLAKWGKRAAIAALPLAGIGGTLAFNALTAEDKPPAIEQPAGPDYTDSRIESTVKVRPPEE